MPFLVHIARTAFAVLSILAAPSSSWLLCHDGLQLPSVGEPFADEPVVAGLDFFGRVLLIFRPATEIVVFAVKCDHALGRRFVTAERRSTEDRGAHENGLQMQTR